MWSEHFGSLFLNFAIEKSTEKVCDFGFCKCHPKITSETMSAARATHTDRSSSTPSTRFITAGVCRSTMAAACVSTRHTRHRPRFATKITHLHEVGGRIHISLRRSEENKQLNRNGMANFSFLISCVATNHTTRNNSYSDCCASCIASLLSPKTICICKCIKNA